MGVGQSMTTEDIWRWARDSLTELLDVARRWGMDEARDSAEVELGGASWPERDVFANHLRDRVLAECTRAWQRGWQPVDVDRMVRRHCTGPVQGLWAQRCGEELAGYPHSTVDPHWWRQLEALGGASPGTRTDASRGKGTRSAAAEASWSAEPEGRWMMRVLLEVELLICLLGLPQVAIIGALPGESHHPERRHEMVDEKILTTVRRLLAQAEGTPYQPEAETFSAAAQSLMARHQIDIAMVESSDPDRPSRGPGAIRVGVDRPYERPKMHLLNQICRANRCAAVWSQHAGFATVVGFPADRRAVELLYSSLLVQAMAALQRAGEDSAHARSRGYRSSFLTGFASRIGQRLTRAAAQEESAARERLGRGGADHGDSQVQRSSTECPDPLALVLHGRSQDIEAHVVSLFPSVATRSRSHHISDPAGFHQGQVVADRATLSVGHRLTSPQTH